MLKSSLCDYSDSYIIVNNAITITQEPDDATDANKRTDERKGVRFKNYAPFIECKNEINKKQTTA